MCGEGERKCGGGVEERKGNVGVGGRRRVGGGEMVVNDERRKGGVGEGVNSGDG